MTASPPSRARDSSGVQRTLLALGASALGAVPLCQLLSDRGWLIDVWVSMLIVVGPALLIRTRRPVGALQVWPGVVLLIGWLTARYLPAHALLGVIPTGGTLRDLGDQLSELHRTTQDGIAPVHSTVAIKLALCAMLGLLAALVDLIAVVGRHGALAGVPLLVVYTVSGAVPRHIVSWQYFVFAAIGFLVLLALDARDDLSTWGHRVPRPERARGHPVIAMSGQRIAALALVAAIVLPLLAPTKATNLLTNLVRGSSSSGSFGEGGGGGTIDPFAALKGDLIRTRTTTLATVKVGAADADRAFYLRENVLSDFTGAGWVVSNHGPEQDVDGTDFGTLPLATTGPTTHFEADITVSGLTGNPPVFATPTSVAGVGSAKWSSQDQLVLGTNLKRGQTYHESVNQPAPTLAELRAASGGVNADTAPWLQLPSIPAEVRTLVTQITAGQSGPYDKARAISDWFADPANGFRYSLQTAAGDSGSDLVDFLNNRVGYCQQYAAAMAVMLRLAQVPARVVLGYTHPPADANGTFTITSNDAHAWVEAYFAPIGWIPFDPTPLSGADASRASALQWAPHDDAGNAGTTAPTAGATTSTVSKPPATKSTNTAPAAQAQSPGGPSAAGWLLPLVLLAVVLALALSPWFVRRRRCRQRLHAARHGDPDPLWAELTDTAVDLGYVWSPARSPRQVVRWLREPVGDARGSLTTLAQAVEHARYSGASDERAPADLAADLHAVTTRLRGQRDRATRLRARFWPASLNWTPAQWLQRGRREG